MNSAEDQPAEQVAEGQSQLLCENCKGSGRVLIDNSHTETCEACEGSGIKNNGK